MGHSRHHPARRSPWLGLAASCALALGMVVFLASRESGRPSSTVVPTAGSVAPAELAAAVPAARRAAAVDGPAGGWDARVQASTEELVQVLLAEDFEPAAWVGEVESRARTLGQEALPELEAILKDDGRSVEEHVAASELVSALHAGER